MSKKYFLPTRREAMQTGAAVGTAFWVTGSLPVLANTRFKMEKINFACIGVEGKGSSDTDGVAREGTVVGLCDIDESRLDKKASRYPDAKKYVDYREMIPELGDKVDAVVVSTPDHSHACASVMAMKAGKHVYVQKPMAWSVNEARIMRKVAKENKVCTQMGNQGTAERALREAVGVLRAGAIGKVTEVHAWTNRPIWPQGEGRPTGTTVIPAGLHWDLFLGPAAERPFHESYHPFKWRGWLDFGTGAIGDMACHTMNLPVMALELFDPISVVAESTGIVENETYPKASKIVFEFAANANRGPVKMFWYDGGNTPGTDVIGDLKIPKSGSITIGTEGKLYSPQDYGQAYQLLPEVKFKDYVKPEPVLPLKSPGHYTEWALAIAAGDPTQAISNFEYAARLTETALLGNVALRAGAKIEYDAKEGKITNIPDANKLLGREYRKGWSL
jgi:predicted dehydrogenase